MSSSPSLLALRHAVAALEPASSSAEPEEKVAFGAPVLDGWLGGGLARGGLHEAYPEAPHHAAAALGFGLGLALRAAGGRPLVWLRHDPADGETGRPHGDGLAAFGLDPETVLLVRAPDPAGALRAADETARCAGIGAALVEIRGPARLVDLTASRRLALAARASGVTLVLVRLGTAPVPSAAASRWSVAGAGSGQTAAGPGRPAFDATLLRHRAGLAARRWRLDWSRERASFVEPALPRAVVPLPAHGLAGGGALSLRCGAG